MISRNNKTKIISAVMAGMMILPSIVFAQDGITKKESIYVTLTQSGDVKSKTVSNWLHSDNPGIEVTDRSSLKNIKNVKGDEQPVIDGEKIKWKLNGKDLFYQGTPDKSLPLEVSITYYLDGRKISPDKLAGKSGAVKIKLQILNKDDHLAEIKGEKRKLYTPFISVAVINLPLSTFSNVKLNTGKLISDGNNQVVTYIALPGMEESFDAKNDYIDIPDELEISADVNNFELGPVLITSTSEIPDINAFKDSDKASELVSGISKLNESSMQLADATGKLSEGQEQLVQNLEKFYGGMGKMSSSSKELASGVSKLGQGVKDAQNGVQQVTDGVVDLSGSAGKLGSSSVALSTGMVDFGEKAKSFAKGATNVAAGLSEIPEKAGQLSTGAKQLAEGAGNIKSANEQLTSGITGSLGAVQKLKAGKQRELKSLHLLISGLDVLIEGSSQLEKIPVVKGAAEKITQGLQKQKAGLAELKAQGNEFLAGISQLEEGIKSIETNSQKLSDEIGKLQAGQNDLAAGMENLSQGMASITPAAEELAKGSEALGHGSEKIYQGAQGLNEGASKFAEGSQKLTVGAQKVYGGMGELVNGSVQLENGMAQLGSGADELTAAAEKLYSGSAELSKHTSALNEAMHKFHDEGAAKLDDEVGSKIKDLEKVVAIKDELIKLSDQYETFSGTGDNIESSVKFIMKTDEIRVSKSESKDVETNVESKSGFWEWLKGLFRK